MVTTGRLITLGDIAAGVRSVAQFGPVEPRAARDKAAHANREAVRRLLITRPGITQSQISQRLNMADQTVGRHVRAIRAEWEAREE